jgi:hypothetical protein
MSTSIPFTLLIIYIRYILSTKAEVRSCFYPNGDRAEGDYPCDDTAEVSFCCAVGYSCLDNKICTGSGDNIQRYNRGSCTDQAWSSPECPQFCQDFSPDGGSWLVNCNRVVDDKGVCCYDVFASKPLGCCTNSSAEVFMLDGSATAFRTISSGAATQNRIVPSSTITSTATPRSTASSVSSPSPIPDISLPSKLSTAVYVGIAIGISVGIALLWAAVYFLRKRWRSRQQDHKLMPFTASPRDSSGSSHSMKQVNVYGDSADRTPIAREPTLPAPRQEEATDDQEFNNSTLYRPSEGLKRGKALERFTAAYRLEALDSWLYECAALAVSVGCLVALAVMLGIYDSKETPQLPYNITLNALISVLSTAAKSSLLFAVAGTLGQVKWVWFTEKRELSDMQTFDDATRGPWGALVLLCSRSIRPLASLGATITILALAYGPFLQQLVRYPVIEENVPSHEATTKQAISLDATMNFSNWDSARVAAWSDISQFDRNANCPTGNCTWSPFTSLGYCSKCSDTTAETSLNCSAFLQSQDGRPTQSCEIYPSQGFPATVWQYRDWETHSLRSIVWIVRETSGQGSNHALKDPVHTTQPEPNSAFQSGYSYLGVENPMLVFGYALFGQEPLSMDDTPTVVKAEICIMTPCERTYQLSVKAGQAETIILNTDYGVSEILAWPYGGWAREPERCWRTTSYLGTNAPVPPVEECAWGHHHLAVTACHGGDPTSGHIFCNLTGVYYSANVTDSIGLLGRESAASEVYKGGSTFPYPEYGKVVDKSGIMEVGFPMEATTDRVIAAHNFSYLMERIAAAMTKAELDNSATFVYGNMTSLVVHVEVAWYWFILPATLNVVAILLLLATAVLSHRHQTRLWKSSTLALLYHGLDDPEPAPDLALANVSEMEQWASSTSATLASAKDGSRIMLKTVSREQAPKD